MCADQHPQVLHKDHVARSPREAAASVPWVEGSPFLCRRSSARKRCRGGRVRNFGRSRGAVRRRFIARLDAGNVFVSWYERAILMCNSSAHNSARPNSTVDALGEAPLARAPWPLRDNARSRAESKLSSGHGVLAGLRSRTMRPGIASNYALKCCIAPSINK